MSLMTLAARLDYPFVTPPSPFSDQIEQATRQWVKQFNLLPDQQTFQRFCSINYGWLGARFFPYTSEAQATIGAQWIAWLFTLDDEFDESAIGGNQRHWRRHSRNLSISWKANRLLTKHRCHWHYRI
jgi:hypothetical protein